MLRALRLAAALFGLAYLASAGFIAVDGLTDALAPADVAIVFGSKVEKDGRVSARLGARLEAAVSLYRQGKLRKILVSGGFGVEGFDEAAVMKEYLLRHEIPDESILVDPGGDDTRQTARHSAALTRQNGLKTALVVSQFFHITRARLALEQAGVTVVGHAHAQYFELRDVYSTAREVIGFYSYLLHGEDAEADRRA